jgi:hypothetical protein
VSPKSLWVMFAACLVFSSSFTCRYASAAPSAYIQSCNDHMPAPWVALYENVNFAGADVCVMGQGWFDLGSIGWAGRASSINVGAEGHFSDDAVGSLPTTTE